MPFSKFWLFFLSLLCGLAVVLLLALEPELRRREADEQTNRLLRAQPVATELLANQAHKLVAASVQMSSDAVLAASLNEMGRGQGELPLLRQTAQAELHKLNRDLGAALLLAVDARGRVLARVGQDEAVYRDSLDGFPLIESALRGYRLDDLWLIDGALYRVAASPIAGPNHDRYVGAIVIGQVLGSEILERLEKMTGVSAAFLASEKLVAASTNLRSESLDPALLLSARKAGVLAGTASGASVFRGPRPGPERLLAFVDMPGEAAQQGAVLVLLAEVRTARTLPGLLRSAVLHIRDKGQPMYGLLGLVGAVLLYAVGLGILRAESAPFSRPTKRAERNTRSSAMARATTEKRTPPVSAAPPPAPEPPSAQSPGVVVAPLPSSMESLPPPLPEQEDALADAIAAVSSVASAHSAETVVAAPMLWQREDPPEDAGLMPEEYALPPPSSNFEPTLVAGAQSAYDGNDPDASFYQVFQEYVLARERCHESVEGLSYEQFRQRLQDSRAQIMRQHGCRGVDFQVYIKEGRAALRATPLFK